MIPSIRTIAATRFGYGFHPGQEPPGSAEELLSSLRAGAADPAPLGGPSPRERAAIFDRFADIRKRNKNDALRPQLKKAHHEIQAMFRRDVKERTLAPIRSPYGFFERLAWFWADHFAVRAVSAHPRTYMGRYEPDAIRPHITGRFHDMLRASATHPAMQLFLTQSNSIGPNSKHGLKRNVGLNENLAREIIELHTLGVGAGYRQEDIRQFAELLTGLSFDRTEGEMTFRRNWAEPGSETVLGRTYGGERAELGDIYLALDDLADHPATARHVCWKLARHFLSDEPPEDVVASMRDAFTATRGELMPVYEAMLSHPLSWETYGQKVKQPFDFVVSAVRAIGPSEDELRMLTRKKTKGARLDRPLKRMNQQVYQPPGPHGWPEEAEAWITPQGLTARIHWASALSRQVERRLDPRELLRVALGDAARDETRFAATRAAERWEGLAFVFASPEFNRR